MAKISAYGETEVARRNVTTRAGHAKIYVMTSGGRVLTRYTGEAGTGYTLRGRVKDAKKRTAEFLEQVIEVDGCTIT
jgi:hypothetical protein